MDLIPTIIDILKVVAGLAVVTLLISYIVNKLKHTRVEENLPNASNNAARDSIDNSPKNLHLDQSANTVKQNSYKIKDASKTPRITDHNKSKHKRSSDRNIDAQKGNLRSQRIEVIKNLTPPTTTETPPKQPKEKVFTDTPKENLQYLNDKVLEKYAEEEKDKMYTLKVDKDNPDKKS